MKALDILLPLIAFVGLLLIEVCLLLKAAGNDQRRCMGMYILGFGLLGIVGTRYILRRKD